MRRPPKKQIQNGVSQLDSHSTLRLRSNGRNVVYQQLPTLLDVTCCIRLHTTTNTDATTPNIVGATMLRVVASICMQPTE